MAAWAYKTRRGTFFIRQRPDGRFTLLFEDDALESHATAQSAAEAAATGTCTWPAIGNPSALGIPSDINAWTRLRS